MKRSVRKARENFRKLELVDGEIPDRKAFPNLNPETETEVFGLPRSEVDRLMKLHPEPKPSRIARIKTWIAGIFRRKKT